MSTHRHTPSLVILLAALLAVRITLAQDGPAYLVTDLADTPNAAAGLQPYDLTVHDDQLYFIGTHPLTGRELWTSDGTEEGTRLVADTSPGNRLTYYNGVRGPLVPLGDAVYFASCDELPVCQLWRSDGTSEGTVPITGFSRRSAGISLLTEWNGALWFVVADARHSALYTSDGTAAGTAPEPGCSRTSNRVRCRRARARSPRRVHASTSPPAPRRKASSSGPCQPGILARTAFWTAASRSR